jgi:p21-activated kinase 1
MDVVASLRRICTEGDPRNIYRGFTKIGQGASGGVYTGHERGTNRLVAIKQMNLEQQPKKDLIINEILVMKDSSHPNIVNHPVERHGLLPSGPKGGVQGGATVRSG